MKYAVRRYWEVCDSVQVEAGSVSEAVVTAHALPIDSTKADYVPDSINSDTFVDVQELVHQGENEFYEPAHR